MVDELNSLSAPLKVFVEERCDIGPSYSVAKDPLYQAYRSWCMLNGENCPSSIEVFGKDLRAVVPTLRVTRPRSGLARLRVYEGIRLKP
jgi:putative DNA primase/helicase